MTSAQTKALKWLADHGGDGAFVRGGATIISQGDIAPFERKTWNALIDAGKVEQYNSAKQGGSGHGRVRILPGAE